MVKTIGSLVMVLALAACCEPHPIFKDQSKVYHVDSPEQVLRIVSGTANRVVCRSWRGVRVKGFDKQGEPFSQYYPFEQLRPWDKQGVSYD